MASRKTASARTPNTPLPADIDLDVAWKRTISKVQNITNWNLDDSTDLTVDDVIANLKPSKRDGKSESHEQAKQVFSRTLQCIQTFGGIAAQSASMVFGPSNQCFNAVNFVIIAAQGYSEAIENISILMERISVFLERLQIYLDDKSAAVKLDRNLRIPVYRVLDLFLVIMGNVHKITTSRRGKVKLSFKLTLLGDDEGIKDALAKLETRVEQVTQVEITTIVKKLSEAAKSIRGVDKKLDGISEAVEKTATSTSHLQAAEDRRSEADKEQKETAALRKALGIDERKEPWEDRQAELRRERINGTGKWLLDFRYPSFSRWSDPKETSLNLLSIRAEQGFGKSFLSSIVVDDLIEKHRNNSRVCIAYYYFNPERDQSESRDTGKESVNKALKSVLWQLAQTNRDAGREFRKLAVKLCESNPDLSKSERLWNLFITDHEKTLAATFYVILDGINDPESEPGHPLSQILNGLTVPTHQQLLLKTRIFLTGRSAGLSALIREMEQKPPGINLSPPDNLDENALNHDDILLYAEERLSEISFYRGTLEADDRALKDRVKKTLARGVRGDFFRLGSKLDEIAKARDVDKVDEILRRADEDRAQVVERQIKQLNETLTADEIEEVNEILKYAIAGFRVPSISSLDLALRLQSRTNKLLGPLLQRIRERYSELFLIEEEENALNDAIFVDLRSDEIESYLHKAEQQVLSIEKSSGRRSGDGEFHEAEIALVERVIKTHMRYVFGEEGQDIYEKYRFNEFFESRRGPTAAQIHFDGDRAHVDIARGCLIALCDHYDDFEYDILHEYAFMYFAYHLRSQVEDSPIEGLHLGKVDTLAKFEIGRKLVRLLREQAFIDAWILKWIRDFDSWTYQTDLVDAVHTWLKNPEIQRALQDMPQEKRWVAALTKEGTLSIMVLANVVVSVAHLWLNGDDVGWHQAFGFMFGYFCQVSLHHLDAFGTLLTYIASASGKVPIPYELASVREVQEVVAWAKNELAIEAEEAVWAFATGTVLQYCTKYKAALAKYQEALDIRPDYWSARQRIATTLALKGDHRKAVTTMNELIEREHGRLDSEVAYTYEYWNNMLPAIVSLNQRLNDSMAAEDASKKLVARALEQQSIDSNARFDVTQMMAIYHKQRKFADLVRLLENLTSKVDLEEGNWLIQIIYSYHSDDSFHSTLVDVGKNSEYSAKIFEAYQAAIDGAVSESTVISKELKICLPLRLRTMLARLKWHLGASRDERHSAIATWEEILLTVPDEEDINFANVIWSRRIAARMLGPALVTVALEKGSGTLDIEVANESLARLEALQTVDHATSRLPVSDVRVPLARMLYLMKQTERARNTIRGYVGHAVHLIEESSGTNMEAADRLVNAFLILEDDVNALAAFTLFNEKLLPPSRTASPMSEKSSNGRGMSQTENANENESSPEPVTGIPNGAAHLDKKPSTQLDDAGAEPLELVKTKEPQEFDVEAVTQLPETNEQQDVGQAEAGASPDSGEPPNSATPATPISKRSLPTLERLDTNVSSKSSPSTETETETDTPLPLVPPEPPIAGQCSSIACDYEWKFPSDIYACRDCFKILCPACYEGLRNGTGTHINCHETHTHLHVPPVDAQKFNDRPRDIVWVSGQDVPLQQWLNSIKSDWGLEQRSVKARERLINAVRRVMQLRAIGTKADKYDAVLSQFKYYNDTSAGR